MAEFEKFKLKYLSICPEVPPDRPYGSPHLIDTSSFSEDTFKDELHTADAIVTLLHKWCPWTMNAFLDLKLPNFEFHRHEASDYCLDTRIIRKVSRVTVRYIYQAVEAMLMGTECGYWDELNDWDLRLNSRIDETTGKWNCIGTNYPRCRDPEEEEEERAGFVSSFATSILLDQKWVEMEGSNMSLSITT